MKQFNVESIAQKAKLMFRQNIEISPCSGIWSNENLYPLTRHIKTDSVWGFVKNKKKDNFAFSVNFDFSNQVTKLYVNEGPRIDKSLILTQFHPWLNDVMDKPALLMFDQHTRSRQITCVIWSDLPQMAETYLKYLIKREQNPFNGISNVKYNLNYGSEEFEQLCQEHPRIKCVDFKKVFDAQPLVEQIKE